MRKVILIALAGLLVAMAVSASPARADGPTCQTVRIPVALVPGQAQNQTVSGQLCTPASWGSGPRQADIMVAGATYDSAYWDWPVDNARYSQTRRTAEAGRAALAYDRPGTGLSSRPLSAALTLNADAFVLHQLVQWLRARGYTQITVIGHSLGSIIAMSEAATYNDLQRLVVTGMVHLPGLGPDSPGLFGSFYPALLDPLFIGTLLDPGYLTTRPGTRATSFYDTGAADPQVIAYDESHKEITSGVQVTDAVARLAIPAGLNDTNRIRVPVLVVVGRSDTLLCGLLLNCSTNAGVLANESPYYSSAPSLTTQTIPATGHSLALHPSAAQSFQTIDQWIRTH